MSALITTDHRIRGRASLRMLGVAMTVFLVLTVLTPVLQRAGAEEAPPIADMQLAEEVLQDDPPIIDDEGEDDGAGEEAPIDQQLVLAEEVTEASIAFYFEKYECDSDYGHDLYELEANCYEPTTEAHFQVYGPEYAQSFVNTFGAQDLKAGVYQFQEFVPDGYGEPIVFCEITDPTGYPSGPAEVVTYDGYYESHVDPGYTLYCKWFNVKVDYRGVVTVIKYECLEALHLDATFENYQYQCTTPQSDVEFKLDGLSTGNPGSYFTDQNGMVSWGDREADTYYLTEFVPEGYGASAVFCDRYFPFDEQVPEFVRYDLYEYAQIRFDLAEGEYITCYWYNSPEEHGGIEVIKYTCPEFDGIIEGEPNHDYFLEDCYEVTDGIPFSLQLFGNDYLEWSTTGDYAPGTVHFDSLGEGGYRLDEEKPEGYGTPYVFCQRYVVNGGGVTEFSWYEADEFDAIQFELGGYEGIICHWFNVPEHDDSTVTVYKYVCDEHVALDENLSYYQDECTEAHQEVAFNLSGEHTGDQGTYETDADGKVFWDGLETDLYTLDEEIPSGYGDPIVFCGFTAYHNGAVYDGFPVRYDEVYDGAVELDIAIPNSDFFCWYFNVPEYDTSITIYKWLCPENFDLYDSAELECTEGFNGVEFTIDGPDGYYAQSVTGDSVPYAVYFGGLEEGYYEIDETVPAGIEYGFIADCWGISNPWPAVYPLYHTSWSDAFSIEIAKGDQVVCNWYNVPEHKDEGKLTVVKYLCNGYVISDLNCAIYTGGQGFTLTPAEGGAPIEFSTGGDGTKTLFLPEGAWTLDEIGGEWCKAKSPDLNQYGQIVTKDGHESVVYIYNCAPPSKTPPVKYPPIKEFPNTGAGTMVMGGGLTGADLAGQAVILLLVAQALVLVAIRRGGLLSSFRRVV